VPLSNGLAKPKVLGTCYVVAYYNAYLPDSALLVNTVDEFCSRATLNISLRPTLMAELSKEYFDQKFTEIDRRFDQQTKELKAYADEQTEKLAAMVADGFEEVKELLDVRERVKQLESDMHKIKESLHII
jgi:ATP-dependent Clp protease ATP-binding subunit ClpA